jgi:hypothetical protein
MWNRLIGSFNGCATGPGFRRAAPLSAVLAWALILAGCRGSAGTSQADTSANPGAAAASEGAGHPEASSPGSRAEVRIPSGTAIPVRLLSTISSETASAGDGFDAELAEALVLDGRTLYEKGARARIRVVSAEASGRLQNPGYLKITFDAIRRPDGTWDYIETDPISARGQSHKKRNTALIGGGAAVGAAIGAIAGGGKGAAIGAASGAGAGTAGAYATGKSDVSFSAERVLKFKTARDVILDQ